MRENHTHTLFQSIVLHLLPGILAGIVYYALVPVVRAHGYPGVMALVLAGIAVLIPLELGFLFYRKGKLKQRQEGRLIPYLRPVSVWQYVLWIPAVLLAAGLLFKATEFTSGWLQGLLNGLPGEPVLDMGLQGGYEKSKLLVTYGLFLVFIVFVLPTVEEFYFRGYLLPRMPAELKALGPVTHSALFALYHTWTPWMFISRTLGVLPLIYVVRQKQNIYIGIAAHCLLNAIDFVVAAAFIWNL